MKELARLLSYCSAKSAYKRKIASLLGVGCRQVDELYREIDESVFFHDILVKAGLKKGFFNFSMANVLRAPTLYVICRIIKPEVLVETGVANGFSSAFILNALKLNNRGRLYSIDLPNHPGQELNNEKSTGWLVPEDLKIKWTLIIGSSKEKLPALLDSLGDIDIFYHDSDHSYENMMFEFNIAWQYLKYGGQLLCDDITENNAFVDFINKIKTMDYLKLFKIGAIIKK